MNLNETVVRVKYTIVKCAIVQLCVTAQTPKDRFSVLEHLLGEPELLHLQKGVLTVTATCWVNEGGFPPRKTSPGKDKRTG